MKSNYFTVAKVLRALMVSTAPLSRTELMQQAGVSYNAVSRILKAMRLEGIVYVAGYVDRSADPVAGNHKLLYAIQTTPFEFADTPKTPYSGGKPVASLDGHARKTGV